MTPEQNIERMEENLEQLTDDVGEMKGELSEMKGVMHQVKEAIMGNPVSGDGGLAGRIKKLEDRVSEYDRMKWWIIGVATSAGFSISSLIDKFLNH